MSRSRQPPFAADVIVCDLDGTLVDTAPEIAEAANRTLSELGLAPFPLPAIRKLIGSGSRELAGRLLRLRLRRELGEDEIESAFTVYLGHYGRLLGQFSRTYPGVASVLERLKAEGRRLGCVTNKLAVHTAPLLRMLALDRLFDIVLSGDSLARRKPDPLPLLYACQKLKTAPQRAVMVGDSASDVQAARAAGMAVVCVSYGYRGDGDTSLADADAVIERLEALSTLLRPPGN